MTLADQLRLLKKQIDSDDPIVEKSFPKVVERAGMIEKLLDEKNAELTKANIPIATPKCGVELTDGGWYEWVIPGKECLFGYITWREAHQAGCVVLTEQERDKYLGKIRGAMQHLTALKMACGKVSGLPESLGRLMKFLEE